MIQLIDIDKLQRGDIVGRTNIKNNIFDTEICKFVEKFEYTVKVTKSLTDLSEIIIPIGEIHPTDESQWFDCYRTNL